MKKQITYAVTAFFATMAISLAAPDKDTLMANEKAAWQAFKDKKADDFKKGVDDYRRHDAFDRSARRLLEQRRRVSKNIFDQLAAIVCHLSGLPAQRRGLAPPCLSPDSRGTPPR